MKTKYKVTFVYDDPDTEEIISAQELTWIFILTTEGKKTRYLVTSVKGGKIRKGSIPCSDHQYVIKNFMLNTEYILRSIVPLN